MNVPPELRLLKGGTVIQDGVELNIHAKLEYCKEPFCLRVVAMHLHTSSAWSVIEGTIQSWILCHRLL